MGKEGVRMVSSGLFSVIVWVFGPLLALVGAVTLIAWLVGEFKSGYYTAK